MKKHFFQPEHLLRRTAACGESGGLSGTPAARRTGVRPFGALRLRPVQALLALRPAFTLTAALLLGAGLLATGCTKSPEDETSGRNGTVAVSFGSVGVQVVSPEGTAAGKEASSKEASGTNASPATRAGDDAAGLREGTAFRLIVQQPGAAAADAPVAENTYVFGANLDRTLATEAAVDANGNYDARGTTPGAVYLRQTDYDFHFFSPALPFADGALTGLKNGVNYMYLKQTHAVKPNAPDGTFRVPGVQLRRLCSRIDIEVKPKSGGFPFTLDFTSDATGFIGGLPSGATYTLGASALTAAGSDGEITLDGSFFSNTAAGLSSVDGEGCVVLPGSDLSLVVTLPLDIDAHSKAMRTTLPHVTLQPGCRHLISLTVDKAGIVECGISVTAWKNGGNIEGDWEEIISVLDVDENGILVLKKGTDRGRMLFFRFGSVVGFTQEGDWAADKVLFNPVTGTPDYSSYASIPVYAGADFDAGRTNVSDAAYHNGDNVKLGKGDPCKLAGLSARQIQGMSAAELDAYYSGWRLPTKEENLAFTGQAAGGSYSDHWTDSDPRYDKWYYSTGSAGGYFPKGQEDQQKNYLPAAGRRDASGSPIIDAGYYWSGTAGNNANGYYLGFDERSMYPVYTTVYAVGSGARCVKEPELAVDQNGILVLKGAGEERGRMLFFQFGSVVGFTQEGDWAADKVLFNPVTGSPDYSNYTSIPLYASADWDANRKDISDPAYHNGANVKAGKGDPCKLVGLSAKRIQNMTASELDAYDSGWRLPTQDENLAFTGQSSSVDYSAHWIASDSRYDKWYYSTGSAGGYFPKGQESQQKNYLPAAGIRLADGSNSVGLIGDYWSSTALSRVNGSDLTFGDTFVYPLDYINYVYGFGARCVRTNP